MALTRIQGLARWPSSALANRVASARRPAGPVPAVSWPISAPLHVRPQGNARPLLVRSADGLSSFVGLLSLQGVLLDANAMSPDHLDLIPDNAFGNDFWAAPLWSWSPLVQHRLRAAVERAAAGDLVRYRETMRVSGNQLITIDITLTPLLAHDGSSTIVCSIIDPSAVLHRIPRTPQTSGARP